MDVNFKTIPAMTLYNSMVTYSKRAFLIALCHFYPNREISLTKIIAKVMGNQPHAMSPRPGPCPVRLETAFRQHALCKTLSGDSQEGTGRQTGEWEWEVGVNTDLPFFSQRSKLIN